MASPQKEDGYTRIANEIMEALCQVNLSPHESRVLWFLLRKTYGWGKKSDWITLSQFSKSVGLDRRHVWRTLKNLSAKKGMIVISRDDKSRPTYGFQKDYSKWRMSSRKMTVISGDDRVSSVEMTRVSSLVAPTKETTTKEKGWNTSSPKTSKVGISPHEFIELYGSCASSFPQPWKLTNGRMKKIAQRLKTHPGREFWREVFTRANQIPFLLGKNDREWKADLDWFVANDENAVKVLEGKYNKGGIHGSTKQSPGVAPIPGKYTDAGLG